MPSANVRIAKQPLPARFVMLAEKEKVRVSGFTVSPDRTGVSETNVCETAPEGPSRRLRVVKDVHASVATPLGTHRRPEGGGASSAVPGAARSRKHENTPGLNIMFVSPRV